MFISNENTHVRYENDPNNFTCELSNVSWKHEMILSRVNIVKSLTFHFKRTLTAFVLKRIFYLFARDAHFDHSPDFCEKDINFQNDRTYQGPNKG